MPEKFQKNAVSASQP